jgi:hypothetical protein
MGLVEWLKVKALSSNPSAAKKKEKNVDNFSLKLLILHQKYFATLLFWGFLHVCSPCSFVGSKFLCA